MGETSSILTPKQVTENHNRTTDLERSVKNTLGWGGGGGGLNMFYGANLTVSLQSGSKLLVCCSVCMITLFVRIEPLQTTEFV